jgi:hypothetical protein
MTIEIELNEADIFMIWKALGEINMSELKTVEFPWGTIVQTYYSTPQQVEGLYTKIDAIAMKIMEGAQEITG